jgi:hypothetical protein
MRSADHETMLTAAPGPAAGRTVWLLNLWESLSPPLRPPADPSGQPEPLGAGAPAAHVRGSATGDEKPDWRAHGRRRAGLAVRASAPLHRGRARVRLAGVGRADNRNRRF